MIAKTLFENSTQKEQRLLTQLTKKKKDIQVLACNGKESCALIDHTELEPYNLIIGIIRNDKKLCIGRYGDQHFSFPTTDPSTSLTRVWIDVKGQNDCTFHINCSDQYYELSNDDEELEYSNEIMIALLHCPDFIQFSVYDGNLPYRKSSHIFTASRIASDNIRIIAHSMLNQHFPGLSRYLIQLEGDRNEAE
ncbi:hypothetical protein [Paenibacillus sp. UASWS1643]|uniref:hypothetical protein n=1 Tax=Paenibacillus sp. UASWS1643 TaxID=2580422 RepID=UPI00123B14DE|nr:hypothetical protein [Paenibacillus sp. UASWS1643]KAA8747237.1 hypothetical protein FE296_23975 [Paenibacillus sp. UASWS1643]